MSAAHLQGLHDAAALRCGARDPGTAHTFRVHPLPGDEDLIAVLAREGSRRVQIEGAGPWRNEALRSLRARLAQPRPTRSRADLSRSLSAWFGGAPGGAPAPDPVAAALTAGVLADLDALLGAGWHGEDSPLLPEAPYAEATLLLGPAARLLLELSLDD